MIGKDNFIGLVSHGNWDIGLAKAILAGEVAGKIETVDGLEEVIEIVNNGSEDKWDYTVTLRDKIRPDSTRQEQYTWDIQEGLRPGHWGQIYNSEKVLRIIGADWLNYSKGQVVKKDGIYIVLGEKPAKYKFFARILFNEATGAIEYDVEIPGELREYSNGYIEDMFRRINKACPKDKRINPETYALEDLPKAGDILYCLMHTQMLNSHEYYILGLVRDVNPDKSVNICASINLGSQYKSRDSEDICLSLSQTSCDALDYKHANEEQVALFNKNLESWGKVFDTTTKQIMDNAVGQPEFGEYVLVRNKKNGWADPLWELAQFAFFEEDSNKRVIHTIGGQTWQQWLLYKGNENKLGKK